MIPPPPQPTIYHITHVTNLSGIVASGGLFSDATMIARGGPTAAIGMSNIKERRLRLPVTCHPGHNVGDFVPFYFCPRSVMLYLIYRGNHPDLSYRGGQGPIVHLEADLKTVVAWANRQHRPWAFSLSNAGAFYTEFRADLNNLRELDWNAIGATDFRGASVKEAKQAEFLLLGDFPWTLVQRIGVSSQAVASQALAAIHSAAHKPNISVQPTWYY